jgi:hypothetical protein
LLAIKIPEKSKTMNCCILLMTLICLSACTGLQWHAQSAEERLVDSLLRPNIGFKLARPVAKASDAVDVKHGISLHHIVSVNPDTGDAKFVIWLFVNWTDYRLQWNPDDFDGLKSIRVRLQDIWTPDIKLYNSNEYPEQEDDDVLAVVEYTGKVLYVPRALASVRCAASDLKNKFSCQLKYGSWTYDASKLDLQSIRDHVDTSTVSDSGDWRVTDTSAQRNVAKYDCCDEKYVDITYTINIKNTIYN